MNRPTSIGLALAAFATAGLSAAASTATLPGQATVASVPEPITCAFHQSKRGASTTVQGVIASSKTISGTYRLTVIGSAKGSKTQIAQASEFSSAPGRPAELGTVTVPRSGIYTAKLAVEADGQRRECVEQIGGRI
jgi:hypothetical protein